MEIIDTFLSWPIKDQLTISIASSAIFISILTFLSTRGFHIKRNILMEKSLRQKQAEIDSQVDNLLREAWNIMGGNPGTRSITEKVNIISLNKGDMLIDRALILNPNSAPALKARGQYFSFQKQYKLAEKWYKKALQANPNYTQALAQYSSCLLSMGRYEEALNYSNIVISNAPYVDWYMYRRASILLKLKRFKEAVVYCNRAININPDESSYYDLKDDLELIIKNNQTPSNNSAA